jgi:hypothetical protein
VVYRVAVLLIALVAAIVGFDIVLQGSNCARLSWTNDSAAEQDNPLYTCWTSEAWDRELRGGSWPGPPWGAGLLGLGVLLGAASGPAVTRQLAYLASPRRRARAAEREAARRRNDRMVTWVTTTRRTSRVLGAPGPDERTNGAAVSRATIPPAAGPPRTPPPTRSVGVVDTNGAGAYDGGTTTALDDELQGRDELDDLDDGHDDDDSDDDERDDTAALLAKLAALRDDGIITDDIYELKRKALLER